MEKRWQRLFFIALLMSCALAVSLAGCGYSIHRQALLPYNEISVGRIENKTLQPKLQDKLQRALVAELMKQGFTVRPGADHTVEGTITSFTMTALSEKHDVTVEYRVIVDAEFRISDREGHVIGSKKISTPFFVTFSGAGELGSLLVERERAEERATADVASEAVGALIYK
jgi:outer membrane lipopolysaccharide assembly protein LptE/RlpB